MKKLLSISLLSLISALAFAAPAAKKSVAQADEGQGITMSTDPAKAAEVEHQAAQLQAVQKAATSGTSAPRQKGRSHRRPAHHMHHHAKAGGSATK